MKKPIFNEFDRFMIYQDTIYGAKLLITMEYLKFIRDLDKTPFGNFLYFCIEKIGYFLDKTYLGKKLYFLSENLNVFNLIKKQ